MAVKSRTFSVPVVMTIAGSDSGGGAGIQADLKTFAAHGVHGTSTITAITAQNTMGVTAVQEIELEVIAAQIDAVVVDMNPVAVKTGMLSSPEIVRLVAGKAREYRWQSRRSRNDCVVGRETAARRSRRNIQERPAPTGAGSNPELAGSGSAGRTRSYICRRGQGGCKGYSRFWSEIRDRQRRAHGVAEDVAERLDLVFDGTEFVDFGLPWIDTTSTHGTGCTFASAITSRLALGIDIEEAFKGAKRYVWEAMMAAYPAGQGHGPLNHMWRLSSGVD